MIDPRYMKLMALFHDRVFRIPEYQRFYSWEHKHRKDLFDDLEKLASDESGEDHFMATIVCHHLPSETTTVGTTDYSLFNIVDGQQRLTTLILILKSLHLKFSDAEEERVEKQELGQLLVKRDRNLILLQTNNANDMLFNAFIRDGRMPDIASIETDADKRLSDAIHDCQRFVSDWHEKNGEVLSLLRLVISDN